MFGLMEAKLIVRYDTTWISACVCFTLINIRKCLQVQFIDGGNLTRFSVNGTPVVIKSISSGNKKQGMIHQFILGNEILQPDINSKWGVWTFSSRKVVDSFLRSTFLASIKNNHCKLKTKLIFLKQSYKQENKLTSLCAFLIHDSWKIKADLSTRNLKTISK